MFKSIRRAGLAAALAVGAMAVGTTAEAHDRYYRDRGDATGAAIVGGVIGLALGAAIASSDRDRYYYDDYYYGRPGGYYRGYPRVYRVYPAYPRGYYYDRRPRRDWRYDRRYGGW